MNEVEVRFNPPLKKNEFLDWMDDNLPMPEKDRNQLQGERGDKK